MKNEHINDLVNYRIEKAKISLSLMFGISRRFLDNNTNRKQNVIDARRFLIYYMRKELGVAFTHMYKHIKDLHHATAIYHCKKIEGLLEFERGLRIKYQKFLIDSNEPEVLELILNEKYGERNIINRNIREIKELISEKK
jgi:hypothetical protein